MHYVNVGNDCCQEGLLHNDRNDAEVRKLPHLK